MQESKQLNNVFLDSLTLQLKNEQQLFALQQHRLDRVGLHQPFERAIMLMCTGTRRCTRETFHSTIILTTR